MENSKQGILHLTLALLIALGLAAPVVIAASTAAGQSALVRIGAAPRLPRGASTSGPAPATAAVSGALVLRPRDEQALEAFIARVASKGSPLFGQYLPAGQFAARFGPAAEHDRGRQRTVAGGRPARGRRRRRRRRRRRAARTLLRAGLARGRRVRHRPPRYRLTDGSIVRASTSAPALPSAIGGSVATVVGLDGLERARPLRVRRPASLQGRFPAAKTATFAHPSGSPTACRAASAAASAAGGLTDDQIAYAYGAFGLYGVGDSGAGVHIGVFEEEPFLTSDIRHFDTCYFGAAAAAGMLSRLDVIPLEGGIPAGPGPDGEAVLDIEDVSAMAPGADIDVYENPETPEGEVAEIAAMVDEDRDQIITSSYGQPCEQEEQDGQPGTQQALDFLFQQAAAQGQTFLGAAGDNGSDTCEEVHRETSPQPGQNPISTGEISSQPYVLGVGGTTITDAATQPAQEHVWNDGPEGGAGGGGISQAFAMPSWQREARLPGIDTARQRRLRQRARASSSASATRPGSATRRSRELKPTTPCRLEPDVSAQADEFTGAVTVYSESFRGEGEEVAPDGWITTGGTSSATPIWAGMLALADASPTCRANPATASGLGFVTPLLYAIASDPSAYAASFNDITEGNIDQYGLDDGKVFPAPPRLRPRLRPRLAADDRPGRLGGARLLPVQLRGRGEPTGRHRAVPELGDDRRRGERQGLGYGLRERRRQPTWRACRWASGRSPRTPSTCSAASSLSITLPPARDTLPAGSPAPQDGAGPASVIVTLTDGQSSASGPASTFEYLDANASGSLPARHGPHTVRRQRDGTRAGDDPRLGLHGREERELSAA